MAGSFLTNDLSAVLSTADFSICAKWSEGGKSINGIFDDDTVEVDLEDGRHIQRAARFHTKSSHNVAIDDTLIINGITYKVTHPENDGTGLVMLFLEKQ